MKIGTGQSHAGDRLNQIGNTESGAKAVMDAHVNVAELATGEYTGTGAAQDVKLQFDPSFVVVFNLTDGTMCAFAVNTTNGGGKSFRQSAALGLVAAVTGITFGTAGQKKFSLGIDAIANINNKVYQYVAFGV